MFHDALKCARFPLFGAFDDPRDLWLAEDGTTPFHSPLGRLLGASQAAIEQWLVRRPPVEAWLSEHRRSTGKSTNRKQNDRRFTTVERSERETWSTGTTTTD